MYHDCMIVLPGSTRASYQPLLNRLYFYIDGEGSETTTVAETSKWWRTSDTTFKKELKEATFLCDRPSSLHDLHGVTTIREIDGDLYSLKMVVIGIWMHDIYIHDDAVGSFKRNAFPLSNPSAMLDMQMMLQGVRD